MKKVFSFLKKPPLTFSLFVYLFFLVSTIFTLIVINNENMQDGLIYLYTCMGISFFYGFYLFFFIDLKNIRKRHQNFILKLSQKNFLLDRYFNDLYFKTMVTSIFSLFMNAFFVIYNLIAGLRYQSIWCFSIAIYYLVLFLIRIYIISNEIKMYKQNYTKDAKKIKRAYIYKIEGILLMVLGLALFTPVTLIALLKKEVSIPAWVAIGNAAYTVYKVINFIRGFVKATKSSNLSIRGLKEISLTETLLSLLNLENTLILTFARAQELPTMNKLLIISSFIVISINLIMALITLIKGQRKITQYHEENE